MWRARTETIKCFWYHRNPTSRVPKDFSSPRGGIKKYREKEMSGSPGIFFRLGALLLRSPKEGEREKERAPESRATTSRESINLCLRHF